MTREHTGHLPVQLLTIRETARHLRCSIANVYALIERGHLPAVRVGRSKGLRIDPRDLAEFIDRRKEQRRPLPPCRIPPRRTLKHIEL